MGGIAKGLETGLKSATGLLKSGVKLAEGKPDEAVKTLHNSVMDGLKSGHEVTKAVVPAAATVVGGVYGGPAGAMLGNNLGNTVSGAMGEMDGTFDELKVATNDSQYGPRNGDLAAGIGPFA